jgi:ABC-type transport system involved in multi-copper enzyme maturation permease subunit
VVLGALCLGSEYGWGTVKTLLSFRPGRLTVYGSQIAALATAVAALVLAAFALSGLSSILIAGSAGASITGPGPLDLVQSMAAGWLVLFMWCLFGVCLAVLFRGPALAIGLGLVWVLAVENLIRAVAPLIGVLSTVEKVLPGAGATSLVAALGGGGAAVVGEGRALAVVALYLALFGTAGAAVWLRRDVQ